MNFSFKSVAILMHDISNNLSPNISHLFTYQANIHSYETRSSSRDDYFVESSRLDIQKNHFQEYGIACLVKYNFKSKIHDLLLQRLSKYDDYIDLSNLIAKLLYLSLFCSLVISYSATRLTVATQQTFTFDNYV